jgi:hypothetical protein
LFVRVNLFLRMPVDPRHDTADEPSFFTQLDYRDDSSVACEGGEGSAEVVCGAHQAYPSAVDHSGKNAFSSPGAP